MPLPLFCPTRVLNGLIMILLLVQLTLSASPSTVASPSTCSSLSLLSPISMTCITCPDINQIYPSRSARNGCICNNYLGQLDNGDGTGGIPISTTTQDVMPTCTKLNSDVTLCPPNKNKYINKWKKDGASQVYACKDCAVNAYADNSQFKCISCGPNMIYSIGQGCICSTSTTATYVQTNQGCYRSQLLTGLKSITSSRSDLYIGCYAHSNPLSCSELINICTYALGDSTKPDCAFFDSSDKLKSFLRPSTNLTATSGVFKLTSSTFAKDSPLKMKLITYLANGNYLNETTFRLRDIFRCGVPVNTDIDIQIGNNLQAQCLFNVQSILKETQTQTYQHRLYQLLVLGEGNAYYDVAIYIEGGNQLPLKRFFLDDAFTQQNTLRFVSGAILSFTLASDGSLVLPKLRLTYRSVKYDQISKSITPSGDQIQTLQFKVAFTSGSEAFWSAAIGTFIAVNILVFIHAGGKTYIDHLNRKSVAGFAMNLLNMWSQWMFYYLLAMSGYWFLFTKTTTNAYLFVPSDSSVFATFYVIAGLMIAFRLVWTVSYKLDRLKTEVLLINWEKNTFRNCWREIFTMNSLAQLYNHRTYSLFWVLLVTLVFLTGFKWENLAAETANTAISSVTTINPKNRMLLYFISGAVFVAVGIVTKILRRVTVLIWPYPFQDFADYCTVTNISLFFIKKNLPHAYYLHASIPDKAQVTFKQINHAIRIGLKKSKAMTQGLPNQDLMKLFSVYMSRELQDKFEGALRKAEDLQHQRAMRYNVQGAGVTTNAKLKPINYREEFIERRLKTDIESMPNEGINKLKTGMQALLGLPPVNLNDPQSLTSRNEVFLDDSLQIVSQVFPNGNEYEQLFTQATLFLLFVLVTGSPCASAAITFFIDEYIIGWWVASSCRKNLQRMTRVNEGFMI